MDRTGKFAVGLAIVTLVVWFIYSQKESQKAAEVFRKEQAAKVEAAKAAEAAGTGETGGTADKTTGDKPAPAAPGVEPAAPQPQVAEKQEELATTNVDYTFTNLGGGLARTLLKSHEAERGTKMILNEFGSIPIGAISEVAGEGTKAPYTAKVDSSANSITFERTDARKLEITKHFVVPSKTDLRSDYIVDLDVTFTNHGAEPLTIPGYFVYTGSTAPVHQNDRPDYTGFKSYGGKFVGAPSFDGGWFSKPNPVYTDTRSNIEWAGVANQYFTTLVTPLIENAGKPGQSGQQGVSVWAKRFDVSDVAWRESGRTSGENAKHPGVEGAIGMPAFTLEPGKSLVQKFTIYSGPREYGRLRLLANDESDIMNFGTFGFVSKVLLNSMNWLNSKLGSYWAAIIVLTLIIKCLLWPMQNKATQSMKRMQLLNPKMTEIREKYKDDPTRMNAEIMKLYKDYGVNPLSGCLPMMVQIPIFFGFYNMLGTAVELRNSHFLWVPDLSQPDNTWHLPYLGWPINVLPLLMAVTMLVQMSLSPKSGDQMQQRMFMFMPLVFIGFCYNYASALALYWTVQNLFSVVQLYVTRNQAPPTLQKVNAPPKRK